MVYYLNLDIFVGRQRYRNRRQIHHLNHLALLKRHHYFHLRHHRQQMY
jgi:hypothetical protein